MERNVVSLETAKRLKAAGFPQVSYYAWYSYFNGTNDGKWKLEISDWLRTGTGNVTIAAPTTQEIADQLPEYVIHTEARIKGARAKLRIWHDTSSGWGCGFFTAEDELAESAWYYSTIAEALAALYLKTNAA